MIVNNLLNSTLMIHDLGDDGYGIAANARNFDLSRIFTQDQIEYSAGLSTARANGWIEVVGERSVKYLKDKDITEEVKVITEQVMTKASKRSKIIEQLTEEPMVVVEPVIVEPVEIKPIEVEKPIIKEEIKEVEEIKEDKEVEKTEIEPLENVVAEVIAEKEERKLEDMSWNEIRGMAKDKGINMRQKRESIIKQLRGEVEVA